MRMKWIVAFIVVVILLAKIYTATKTSSKEEAVDKVRALPEVVEYFKRVPYGQVAVNGEEDSSYLIQVYEIKDGHTATFNWYKIDKTSGEVKKEF